MKGRSFFLLSLMMAVFLNACGAKPTPIAITSPLYPGATVVSGTAQKIDASYKTVTISLCVTQSKESKEYCKNNPAPLKGGLPVTLDNAGNFIATLQTALKSEDIVYAVQSLTTDHDVVVDMSFPQPISHAPECISNALSGYVSPVTKVNACTIHLDRNNFATPPAITVPKGTVVLIELDNAHWNETVQFNRTTTKIPDQDIAADVFKAMSQNLQGLTASVRNGNAGIVSNPDNIEALENNIQNELEDATVLITNANIELTCLESYRALANTSPKQMAQCASTILVGPISGNPPQDTFSLTKKKVLDDLNDATRAPLAATDLCKVPIFVAARQILCNPGAPIVAPTVPSGCPSTPAPGAVVLTPLSLSRIYTGLPIAASATTTPSGQALTINYTGTSGTSYGPSSTPPTNPGSYMVNASVSGPPAASTSGMLIISSPADAKVCSPDAFDRYKVRLDGFNNSVAALEKVQQPLLADINTLENWSGVLDGTGKPTAAIVSQFTQSRNRTSTITVVATEVVSGATSNLGTLTINWQTQPFVLSSGILLSMMPYRSYAISQLIVNGAPIPDPTNPGKYLAYINQTVTHPSISFPMVFGNYRIGRFSRYDWENKCPNHCAFLVTGGMGYNIVQKTADFAGGLSFQIGSVLLTPAAHVGRETLLTNGLYPGEILGSNPPSALLTQNAWTVHFGLALTIAIPTP
jgi:MBG domain